MTKSKTKALREAFESKNTTTEQFLRMVQQIKQNKLFPNAKWGFVGSVGGGTSYVPFDEFVRNMTDLIRTYKDRKDPITNYYVWSMEGSGLNYSDIQRVVNQGPDAVVQFAQAQGDKVTKISTGWDSKGSQEFAQGMGRGDYGSLDESIGADLDFIAQESNSFEEFINKVKSKPEYKNLDILDSEVKSFLRAIYNNASGLAEARGFSKNELRLTSMKILKSIGVPLSQENIQDMLNGLMAKIKKHNAGAVIAEAVNEPVEPEVVNMIKELAESYGVTIPTYADRKSLKPWSTATKMAEYALHNMQASERKSFIREFVRIKKAVKNDEFLI